MSISRTTQLQRVGGLLRVGDHRRDQVRDALVGGELHPLRVDQHHPHLVRGGPGEDRQDQRVDAAGLAGAGRAGDQQVRHLGQVGDDEAALDVLAERDQHRVVVALRHRRAQHVAEHHDLGVGVRDLDADRGLARDRAEDPDVGALDRVGDVAGQVGDPLDLDARAELDLVAGDGRAAAEAGDRAVDVELGEHLLQRGDHLVVGPGVLQVRAALRQGVSEGSVYMPAPPASSSWVGG